MAGHPALCALFHNLKPEGAQRAMMVVVAGLCRKAQKEGHSTSFYAMTLADGPLRSELANAGVRVVVCESQNALATAAVEKIGKDGGFAIVNTVMLHHTAAQISQSECVCSGRAGLLWYIHETNPALLFSQEPSLEENLQRAAKGVYRFVFVAHAAVREYAALELLLGYTEKMLCVHNGVEIDRIQEIRNINGTRAEVRSQLIADQDTILLVTVGTPKVRKGQKGLIHALARIKGAAAGHNVALVVVGCTGDSDYERSMLEEASELGVKDNLHMIGQGDSELVTKHLIAADVYCCNSDIETLPLAILEAMVCELPVVSTNVSGIPEEVDDGVTGFLYTPNDDDALVSILERLVKDHSLRKSMGQAGGQKVQASFTLFKMIDGFDDILRSFKNLNNDKI